MIVVDHAAADGEIRGAVSAVILEISVQDARKNENGDLALLHLLCEFFGISLARVGKSRIHSERYALAHTDTIPDVINFLVDPFHTTTVLLSTDGQIHGFVNSSCQALSDYRRNFCRNQLPCRCNLSISGKILVKSINMRNVCCEKP